MFFDSFEGDHQLVYIISTLSANYFSPVPSKFYFNAEDYQVFLCHLQPTQTLLFISAYLNANVPKFS